MKKLLVTILFVMVSSSAMAQYVYGGRGPITGNVYFMPGQPVYIPVPHQPSPSETVVVQPPPNTVVVQQPPQTIVEKQVIVKKQVIVNPPAPTPPRPVCTTYPDPWDTLGYIFGDPFMITTCY